MKFNVGLRQSYLARGLVSPGSREHRATLELFADFSVELYVGDEPPSGIWMRPQGGVALSGAPLDVRGENAKGIGEAHRGSATFVELVCLDRRSKVTGSEGARVFDDPLEDSRRLQWIGGYVIGVFALLYGPQAHYLLVDEEALRIAGEEREAWGALPTAWFVSHTSIDSVDLIARHFPQGMGRQGGDLTQRQTGLGLHWWQKAVKEEDPVDKFFYLFVSMECILGVADGERKGQMKQRFQALANAKAESPQDDIDLFAKANDLRNRLVHQGSFEALVEDASLRELIWPFEYMVQKYLRSVVLS